MKITDQDRKLLQVMRIDVPDIEAYDMSAWNFDGAATARIMADMFPMPPDVSYEGITIDDYIDSERERTDLYRETCQLKAEIAAMDLALARTEQRADRLRICLFASMATSMLSLVGLMMYGMRGTQ